MIALPRRSTSSSRSAIPVYYLAWRLRRSHPWHSEEFLNRFEAHTRYLQLQSRGYETYLETREKTAIEG